MILVRRLLENEKMIVLLLLAPAIIILVLLSVYPLIYSVRISLFDWTLPNSFAASKFIGFNNYVDILKSGEFWGSTIRSFIYVSVGVFTQLILGVGAALLFNRPFFGNKVLRMLMLTATVTSSIVAGTLWRLMMDPSNGLINYYLRFLGIDGPAWLGDRYWSMVSIIIVDIWQWTPFIMIVALASLASMPEEPFEAASLDGASSSQKFLHITMPFLKSALLVAIMIRIMDAFREFTIIYSLTKGGPGSASETLTILGYNQFQNREVSVAATVSILMAVIVTVVSSYLIKKVGDEVWQ
jgi:multiple sugar transport system permease protein